ncbi:MAG TPA: HNH endonuclease signature motif containing protein [Smithellaceae bacterium]|nr:HNH endonuclease signature motif containing protein [Smithellaceae bacterium]
MSTEQRISDFSQPREKYRCLSCSKKGKARPYETRKKISETRLSRGYIGWSKGKECPQFSRENNPNWRGGISETLKGVRQSKKYRFWRDTVFERDNYTCQISGVQSYDEVEAHHIIQFSDLLRKYNIDTYEKAMDCAELWDVSNGITMLKSVHRSYHEIYCP